MTLGCKTSADVMKAIKDNGVQMIDIRLTDVPGTWQHISYPAAVFEQDQIEEGLGFDGSSVRGFKTIEASDMLLMPDPTTAFIDPFYEHKTLVMIADVLDPVTGEFYSRDPRGIAKKAEAYLKSTGIGDTAFFGPEAEFFVFDNVQFGQDINSGSYLVDSVEGWWNMRRAEGPNLGYKIRPKEGYFPCAPTDTLQDLRARMALTMIDIGLTVECQHHEVATAGQCEIDMKFDTLLAMADHQMKYKYVVKNEAAKAGKSATFMPKPLYGDNGSGMHCHQSIWSEGKPLFAGDKEHGLSDLCRWYIGGLLKHAPAILAFAAPTTNSYRRLVPGYEAPVNLAWSARNRSAACRIPMYSNSPKAKRVEFRCPDPSCNPYIAFSAMLMAGLDGIRNKIDPGEATDKNIYDLPPEELAHIPTVPGSLGAALDALAADHEFLMEGEVFTKDFIDNYIAMKRANEVEAMALRPHPYEFVLYYDC
ncbi:MAG TPA: type I glutamate--ammonia ligase [Geminicoccus sp.]|uniref:type I glutamate--ammonia ligase n=1 Tax=Geminicoccus sp. TaxID=2024832 RepID=UPI002B915CE4|nr:type I glutamate--ammonia ligase [Geminicoccus sp.]HWL67710.1 type I glutamate--ammonia ligase [Geminicoccus sp.]